MNFENLTAWQWVPLLLSLCCRLRLFRCAPDGAPGAAASARTDLFAIGCSRLLFAVPPVAIRCTPGSDRMGLKWPLFCRKLEYTTFGQEVNTGGGDHQGPRNSLRQRPGRRPTRMNPQPNGCRCPRGGPQDPEEYPLPQCICADKCHSPACKVQWCTLRHASFPRGSQRWLRSPALLGRTLPSV